MSLAFRRSRFPALAAFSTALLAAGSAWAEGEAPTLDTGDTAWLLASSALVLMMTLPGLALFYGGPRAREEHALAAHAVPGLGGVVGRALDPRRATARVRARQRFIGGLSKLGLAGITPDTLWTGYTIPEYAVRDVPGDVRDHHARADDRRVRGAHALRPLSRVHRALAALRVLPARAHGLGRRLPRPRSARRTSPAASSCTCRAASRRSSPRSSSASAAAIGKDPMPPHNLPFAVIGAALLWVGWFGFNAGSELAADGIAGLAFLTTHTAAVDGARHLDGDRVAAPRQADRARRGDRRGRGSRRDHAGLRVRDARSGSIAIGVGVSVALLRRGRRS